MSNGDPNRVLLIHNPVCSKPEMADRVIDWFRDSKWWGSNLEVCPTQDPADGSNAELIRDALEPGDVVLGLGGDGLAHDLFNGIRRAHEEGKVDAAEVSMVPCPTGNGNDLSRSLYGRNILRGRGRQLWELLDRGDAAWLDGLKLDSDDGTLDRYVHGYVGVGFTAEAAAAINVPEFRGRKLDSKMPPMVFDAPQVLRAARDRRPFEYRNGSGSPVQAQEILYTLIPRIAAGVIRVDTQPLDREALRVELGVRAFIPRAAAKVSSGVLLGGIKGEAIAEEGETLTLGTPAAIQYDGEPDELPAGTTVSISHRLRIVRALV